MNTKKKFWHRFLALFMHPKLKSSFSVTLVLAVFLKATTAITSEFNSLSNLSNPSFFPIGVWLQAPVNAARYKDLGVNVYIGVWEGPTTEQLDKIKNTGMLLICRKNEVAKNVLYDDTIVAWLHQDEPDNSQKRTGGLIYNPPIDPSQIIQRYATLKDDGSNKPVFLNLGQGVAWDQWKGRGIRTNHPEDYSEYVKGADIVSYDIYPVTHNSPEIRGKLEVVGYGVQRLKSWVTNEQKVWNIIGVSRIKDPERLPTPLEVRSQVWMSIIHGSRGIIYFVHQFKPRFIEAAIFEDPEMMHEVKELNALIQRLAVVINSPDTNDIKEVTTTSAAVPIAAITKRHTSFLYLFSVAMRNKATTADFLFNQMIADQEAEVVGESRMVRVIKGRLIDHFNPYEPHIYKIDLGSHSSRPAVE